MTKNFTALPTKSRWSGYDASEAISVHRESLWNPKRERAGLGHLAKVSVTARPLPPSQSRRPMQSPAWGGGANLTMAS